MKWIDVELGSVWKDDKDYKYNLMLEIQQYWTKDLATCLWNIYVGKFHKFYSAHVLHDGNRQCGLLSDYIHDYENGGDLLVKEGWHTLQKMLEYVREAEVFIALYDKSAVL